MVCPPSALPRGSLCLITLSDVSPLIQSPMPSVGTFAESVTLETPECFRVTVRMTVLHRLGPWYLRNSRPSGLLKRQFAGARKRCPTPLPSGVVGLIPLTHVGTLFATLQ